MNRFPDNFRWGTATSAYQIEGGWLDGGRGLTIWDAFSHTPGRVARDETGDVACDHYGRFRDDVELMSTLGVNAYRFSIAWSRILPGGRGVENPAGIKFYDDLIDSLLEHGIEPWVTLYHWDLPLALEMEIDGWLNPEIADHFADYAEVCFARFGDRVKRWITINEGWVVALGGYTGGALAPGRRSRTEPYIVAHNLLRSHAKAVDRYRRKFQTAQGGVIGITNNCDWRIPRTDGAQDRAAAERAVEFFLGWFADPIYFGDYPESMRSRLAERLPRFSSEDSELLRGSNDFFGLNHYTTEYAAEPMAPAVAESAVHDDGVELSSDVTWRKTDVGWNVVPAGIGHLLRWIDKRYSGPEIYITENGCAVREPTLDLAKEDVFRIEYLDGYLRECLGAIGDGVKLRGYFLWSLLDNYEWAHGYSKRFGIHYVDYRTLQRTRKASASWYEGVVRRNGFES